MDYPDDFDDGCGEMGVETGGSGSADDGSDDFVFLSNVAKAKIGGRWTYKRLMGKMKSDPRVLALAVRTGGGWKVREDDVKTVYGIIEGYRNKPRKETPLEMAMRFSRKCGRRVPLYVLLKAAVGNNQRKYARIREWYDMHADDFAGIASTGGKRYVDKGDVPTFMNLISGWEDGDTGDVDGKAAMRRGSRSYASKSVHTELDIFIRTLRGKAVSDATAMHMASHDERLLDEHVTDIRGTLYVLKGHENAVAEVVRGYKPGL